MNTDELKALLRECREWADDEGEHSGANKESECMQCVLVNKIDAALSSDFAVMPRKITREMSDALNAMAQCEGFIEEGYDDMIKVAEEK